MAACLFPLQIFSGFVQRSFGPGSQAQNQQRAGLILQLRQPTAFYNSTMPSGYIPPRNQARPHQLATRSLVRSLFHLSFKTNSFMYQNGAGCFSASCRVVDKARTREGPVADESCTDFAGWVGAANSELGVVKACATTEV